MNDDEKDAKRGVKKQEINLSLAPDSPRLFVYMIVDNFGILWYDVSINLGCFAAWFL